MTQCRAIAYSKVDNFSFDVQTNKWEDLYQCNTLVNDAVISCTENELTWPCDNISSTVFIGAPSSDDAIAANFMAKFGYMGSFHRAAFLSGLKYRHSDSKMFKYNIVSCASLMKIGRVTPEIARVTNISLCMRRQKSAYLTEYPNNYWTDLNQRFSNGRRMYGDYKTCICFVVVQEMLQKFPCPKN